MGGWPVGYLQDDEELSSVPPKANPSSGREEDLNPGPPDYKSSALPLGHARLPTKEIWCLSSAEVVFVTPWGYLRHFLHTRQILTCARLSQRALLSLAKNALYKGKMVSRQFLLLNRCLEYISRRISRRRVALSPRVHYTVGNANVERSTTRRLFPAISCFFIACT